MDVKKADLAVCKDAPLAMIGIGGRVVNPLSGRTVHADREVSNRAGDFGEVRPVRLAGKTQHVDWQRRLELRDRF